MTALNDAVTAAAKDGLEIKYEGRYEGGMFGWSMTGNEPAPLLLTPTIMRKL